MQKSYSENSLVNWVGDNSLYPTGDYWTYPDIRDYYIYHYPVYFPTVIYEQSRVDKAFAVLKLLQEKKIINITKVAEFIETINELVKIL